MRAPANPARPAVVIAADRQLHLAIVLLISGPLDSVTIFASFSTFKLLLSIDPTRPVGDPRVSPDSPPRISA